jgi:hypothetical protein
MLKLKFILVLMFIMAADLCACVDAPDDACGPFPSRGHYTVTFEQRDGADVVVLSRADFDALTAERHAMKEWMYCTTGQ